MTSIDPISGSILFAVSVLVSFSVAAIHEKWREYTFWYIGAPTVAATCLLSLQIVFPLMGKLPWLKGSTMLFVLTVLFVCIIAAPLLEKD